MENIEPLPCIELRVIEDRSPKAAGFLRLRRRIYQATYADGSQSHPFEYDEVEREALDAVVVLAHFRTPDGERHVYLRSCIRPPLLWRDPERSAVLDERRDGALWELPAGLIERNEQGSEQGLYVCARRELHEELGFEVEIEQLRKLGRSMYPVPAMIAERQFFFEVEVDPAQRSEPVLDGSALERGGLVISLPLHRALEWCQRGAIEDGKTELGLRRLRERLA